MHKRTIAFLVICSMLFCPLVAYASQFSADPDAIEAAAKSVLMLEVYDDENELLAIGSGFVAFNNRTLVTNYHVIEGADWMMANSDDGYQYMVTKILTADEEKDIAICEFMSPTDLQPLELNVDGELKRAENVVAIGNPKGTIIGATNTVSIGNISALYNDGVVDWIQFTAPISSGSSGGALFDNDGRIIGMTSASLIDAQNMNLAIHISEIKKLFDAANDPAMSFRDYFIKANTTPTPMPTNTPEPTPAPTSTPIPTPTPFVIKQLSKGDVGSDVAKMQKELFALGYYIDESYVYKNFSSSTERAVYRFNICNKTSKYNPYVATVGMLEKLYSGTAVAYSPELIAANTTPYKELKKGDKGEEVKRLQEALIQLGYLDGKADGVFGKNTEEAVKLCNLHLYGRYGIRYPEIANNELQQMLFSGKVPVFSENGMTLYFPDRAETKSNMVSGDSFRVCFQVKSKAERKDIKAFECYIYAQDVWGKKVINVTAWTTNKKVKPGETAFTDYITLNGFSKMETLFVGIHKIIYTDGTIYEISENQIKYSSTSKKQ